MPFKKTLALSVITYSLTAANHAYAAAECLNYSNLTIYVPNTVLQEHASYPVGGRIGPEVKSSGNVFYNCRSTDESIPSGKLDMHITLAQTTSKIEGRQIYATGLKGLGFAISGSFSPSGKPECTAQRWFTGSSSFITLCTFGAAYSGYYYANTAVQFYKTAEDLAPGVIGDFQIGDFRMYYGNAEYRYRARLNLNGGSVTTGTCGLTSSSIKVDMAQVFKNQFQGVGLSTKDNTQKDFQIPLNCHSGTSVNIQIEGNSNNAAQGLLKLDANNLAASGVAIQLLYNKIPVKIGEFFNVGTASSAGTYNIPLTARYLQTEHDIKPGVANSTATFILKYY